MLHLSQAALPQRDIHIVVTMTTNTIGNRHRKGRRCAHVDRNRRPHIRVDKQAGGFPVPCQRPCASGRTPVKGQDRAIVHGRIIARVCNGSIQFRQVERIGLVGGDIAAKIADIAYYIQVIVPAK